MGNIVKNQNLFPFIGFGQEGLGFVEPPEPPRVLLHVRARGGKQTRCSHASRELLSCAWPQRISALSPLVSFSSSISHGFIPCKSQPAVVIVCWAGRLSVL